MDRVAFENKWLTTFVPDLTNKQYKDCYVYQYLWHVFSYGLIPQDIVLTGDMARKAYDSIDKENAIMIQLWDEETSKQTMKIIHDYKNWEKIEDIPELYIVARDWTWTYVSTHENGWCGPYFYKIGDLL